MQCKDLQVQLQHLPNTIGFQVGFIQLYFYQDIGNSLAWFLSGLSPSMTQTHGSERLHHVHSHSIDNFSKKLKGFRKNPT